MTAGFTALLFAVGAGAWVYAKFSHRSNNAQTSLIAAGVVGLIAFLVFFTILKVFLKV